MDNNELTLSSLIQAKNQRKHAEHEVERLKNRLSTLARQEKQSADNVKRMRKLSEKLNQIREVRYEDKRNKEEKRKRECEELGIRKEEFRKRSYDSCVLKDESIRKRIRERKTEYFTYKNWIKDNEEAMEQEMRKKNKENFLKKEMILEHKMKVAMDRQAELHEKIENAQAFWQERVNREKRIYFSKVSEKDLMLDIDLTIIEMMQNHRL